MPAYPHLAEDCPELCADQAVDQQVDRGVDHQEDVGKEPGSIIVMAEKCFFLPKMGFNPKNNPKFLERLIFIWEKATFFFEQLSWPEHG